jgi:transcriptional regulator with XRE-family HTH domain
MIMSRTTKDELIKTREGLRLYQQERTILGVTELICEIMEQQDVSRAELANRLGKTKGYISQVLDGSANMTIRTMSDILTELGRQLKPGCELLPSVSQTPEGAVIPFVTNHQGMHWPEATLEACSIEASRESLAS